jgi:hypothetical protein
MLVQPILFDAFGTLLPIPNGRPPYSNSLPVVNLVSFI